MDSPITECELRDVMRSHLQEKAASSAGRLFEEFGIEGGDARLDLALVNTRLNAFELKSDLDSFGRMHNQIHAYSRVFDRVTIVTGPVHAEQATSLAPFWWAVSSASRRRDGSLALKTVRRGKANPSQDLRSMAMLLWRDECIETLTTYTGNPPPRKATRPELHELLTAELDLCALRQAITKILLKRENIVARAARTATAQLSLPTDDATADCLF